MPFVKRKKQTIDFAPIPRDNTSAGLNKSYAMTGFPLTMLVGQNIRKVTPMVNKARGLLADIPAPKLADPFKDINKMIDHVFSNK